MDDLNLTIERASKGDKEAFEELISLYGNRLYGFTYGIIRDENDALDIVQETFLKAYEHLRSFDMSRNFVTWLFTIAKNNSLNLIKARKRYGLKHEEAGHDKLEMTESRLGNPEQETLRRIEKSRLIKSLDSLPEKYRAIIYLKYIEGLSYKEISQRLSLRESLVESRIFTARQKLLSLMKEGE